MVFLTKIETLTKIQRQVKSASQRKGRVQLDHDSLQMSLSCFGLVSGHTAYNKFIILYTTPTVPMLVTSFMCSLCLNLNSHF